MKTLKLQQKEHKTKIGKDCPYYEPNVREDCLLELDGEVIGFYINNISNYSDIVVKYTGAIGAGYDRIISSDVLESTSSVPINGTISSATSSYHNAWYSAGVNSLTITVSVNVLMKKVTGVKRNG